MGVMEMEIEISACKVALVWWLLAIEKDPSLFSSILFCASPHFSCFSVRKTLP